MLSGSKYPISILFNFENRSTAIDHTLTVEVTGLADSCIASGSICCQLLPDRSSSIRQTRVSSSSKVSNTCCIGPNECKARILAIAKTSSVESFPNSRLSKMPVIHTLCAAHWTFWIITITGYQVTRVTQLLEGSGPHFVEAKQASNRCSTLKLLNYHTITRYQVQCFRFQNEIKYFFDTLMQKRLF